MIANLSRSLPSVYNRERLICRRDCLVPIRCWNIIYHVNELDVDRILYKSITQLNTLVINGKVSTSTSEYVSLVHLTDILISILSFRHMLDPLKRVLSFRYRLRRSQQRGTKRYTSIDTNRVFVWTKHIDENISRFK